MATAQRIYVVTSKDGKSLVKATSQAQAIRHVVANLYTAHTPTPLEVAEMMSQGMELQQAAVAPEQTEMEV